MGRPVVNLVGKKFGRLTVEAYSPQEQKGRSALFRCHCDCGKEIFATSAHLQSLGTRSCGCLQKETAATLGHKHTKHGHALNSKKRTREYISWDGMKQRCMNSKHPRFKYYGGRGIKVCQDWKRSFENFLNYLKTNSMHPKPAGLSIDRIDNDGNYEPGNIRWATQSQQVNNSRTVCG